VAFCCHNILIGSGALSLEKFFWDYKITQCYVCHAIINLHSN